MLTDADADLLLLDEPAPAVAAWLTTFADERAASDARIAEYAAGLVAECGGDSEGDDDAE